jgi:hypothetical protein
MENNVVAKYFSYQKTEEEAKLLTEKIAREINFTIEAKIFFGKIYDQDKVGSYIVKGKYNDKLAVLKMQLLGLPMDEVEIIKKFNEQNESKIIRLPEVFLHKEFERERGYGYIVSEYINYPHIYRSPFATEVEKNDFLFFYEEYRNNCLNKPFFPKNEEGNCIPDFFKERVEKWASIAESKNNLTDFALAVKNDFIGIVDSGVDFIGFDFQHGHLTQSDIYCGQNEYVLLSNLFWEYKPEWYDTTFHLWGGIKSNTDLSITSKKVIDYIEDWRQSYRNIGVIKKDKMFDKKFMILMMERCVGALTVDYTKDKNNSQCVDFMRQIFYDVFKFYQEKYLSNFS